MQALSIKFINFFKKFTIDINYQKPGNLLTRPRLRKAKPRPIPKKLCISQNESESLLQVTTELLNNNNFHKIKYIGYNVFHNQKLYIEPVFSATDKCLSVLKWKVSLYCWNSFLKAIPRSLQIVHNVKCVSSKIR